MTVPYPFIRKQVVASVVLATAAIALTDCEHAFARDKIPAGIQVYTVTDFPVSVPRNLQAITRVINLDHITAIEAALSEGLDRIPESSRDSAAASRLSPALQLELKRAWQALFTIREEAITHLPAIVFDGQGVWYGSDLRRAVTRYRGWMKTEGGS